MQERNIKKRLLCILLSYPYSNCTVLCKSFCKRKKKKMYTNKRHFYICFYIV